MALVSIRPFLVQPEEESLYRSEEEAACRKVIGLLLEGVATYAPDLDHDARQRFRERIFGIRENMSAEASAGMLIANGDAAVQAIADYARQTNRLVQSQSTEMQAMMALLSRTAADIGQLGRQAVARLRSIGEGLERMAAGLGVAALTARLGDCRDEIRADARQQEAESKRIERALGRELSRKAEAWRNLGLDPVAELPGEVVAQAQLLSALRGGGQQCVVVLVLDSARQINRRFGRVAGDEAIRALKRHLAGHLASSDRVFRWSGSAIVASLATTESLDQVNARLSRFLERPIERIFEVDGRPVSIPLPAGWSVFPLFQSLEDLRRQIDDFIASRDSGDEDQPLPDSAPRALTRSADLRQFDAF